MLAFDKELQAHPTDLVIIIANVASTMNCSIASNKLNIKIDHLEAGIRSINLTMPEAINRMFTDNITYEFFYHLV